MLPLFAPVSLLRDCLGALEGISLILVEVLFEGRLNIFEQS
jgi:hypothetical protein